MTEKQYKIVGILAIIPSDTDTLEWSKTLMASHKLPWAAKHEPPQSKEATEASWKDITDKPVTIEEA